MQQSSPQRGMYYVRDASMTQRITAVVLEVVWLAVVWWLLFGGGLATAGGWFGWTWTPGNPVRRVCLAVALSIYVVRLFFTMFVYLKRGVTWAEVFTVAPWILCIDLLLAVSGAKNPTAFSMTGVYGFVLFALGSWMNSYAEHTRHVWKKQPENRGCLYTEGLFRYSRHPNYCGDLLSFFGLCMIAGTWLTVLIPALMLAGFVFVNVPALDDHLRDRYGASFEEYARRTPKLIPFLY